MLTIFADIADYLERGHCSSVGLCVDKFGGHWGILNTLAGAVLWKLLYAALFEAARNIGSLLIQLAILKLMLSNLHKTDLRILMLHAHLLEQTLLSVNFVKLSIPVVFAIIFDCLTANMRQIACCGLGGDCWVIMGAGYVSWSADYYLCRGCLTVDLYLHLVKLSFREADRGAGYLRPFAAIVSELVSSTRLAVKTDLVHIRRQPIDCTSPICDRW